MKNKSLIITGVIIAVIAIWFIASYNGLISKEEQVNRAWSQVENVYQRRMDLIPNLVATVQGFADQEQEVLTRVTELRSRVGSIQLPPNATENPEQLAKYQEAQSQLSGALSRLLVVSENYPDLKSDDNFETLQRQIEGSENRISVERKRFIDAVQEYNSSVRRFPGKLVAAVSGFDEMEYYQADEGAEQAPEVEFE